MPQDVQLGEIRTYPLRQIWPHERYDLSAWMARPENLRQLGQAIGIGELTLEGAEFGIGADHAVDIVCRNVWGERVAIENQFGKSDPDHLGRGVVYLTNIGASTLVWIAERLRDPHRMALSWLNENTPEAYGFFGVEVEALTIDESRPGVRFNVVVRPNTLSRRATRNRVSGPLTDEQVWLQRYWTSFAVYLDEVGAGDWLRELPRDRYWGGDVGRAGFRIFGVVNRKDRLLEVQLDIRHAGLTAIIEAFGAERAQIDHDIGAKLDWRSKPQSYQIAVQNVDLDPNNEATWPQQHEWLLARLQAFRRVFKDRIASLAPTGTSMVDGTAPSDEPPRTGDRDALAPTAPSDKTRGQDTRNVD